MKEGHVQIGLYAERPCLLVACVRKRYCLPGSKSSTRELQLGCRAVSKTFTVLNCAGLLPSVSDANASSTVSAAITWPLSACCKRACAILNCNFNRHPSPDMELLEQPQRQAKWRTFADLQAVLVDV